MPYILRKKTYHDILFALLQRDYVVQAVISQNIQ